MRNPRRVAGKIKRKLLNQRVSQTTEQQAPSVFDIIFAEEPFAKDGFGRIAMTISCRDTDYIPKVKDAGKIKKKDGQDVQVMHNGLLVRAGGYHGDWMSKVIVGLNGHHEPQEEKVFYEIVKKLGTGATMIELGSFWCYYSLWFNKAVKNARNICCEPDEANMKIGRANAKLNNATNVTFIDAAAGSNDHEKIDLPMDSNPSIVKKVTVRTVDGLVRDNKVKQLDLLHMDVQGVELEALHGAIETIATKKIRFLMVSTHHYFFSRDPMTHQKCLEFIEANGGHIIASHTVLESFSGDGLIAASFWEEDAGMKIDLSINRSDESFFRPYEKDLSILIEGYRKFAEKNE